MFEDNWPVEPGKDNDLNDVVFEYDLKVTECQNEDLLSDHGYKEGLKMTLDIRAKGGDIQRRLAQCQVAWIKKYIDENAAVTRIVLKKGQGMEEELADGIMNAEMDGTLLVNLKFCKVTVDTKKW